MLLRDWVSRLGMSLTCMVSGSLARAEALPLKTRVQSGLPAHDVEVQITNGDAAGLDVGGKRHKLALQVAQSARVQSVRVAEKGVLNVVYVEGQDAKQVFVVGGRSGTDILFSGRADLHGDPGERTQAVVEIGAANEQGVSTVSVGTRYEGVSLCGDRPVLFDRMRVDPQTLGLMKADSSRLSGSPVDVKASAMASARRSIVSALRAAGSSERVTSGPMLSMRPTAVVDDNPDTAWQFASKKESFLVLRWERTTFPIEALTFVAPKAPARLPSSVVVLSDSEPPLRIMFPAEPANAFEAKLPSPLKTSCLALVVTEAADPKKPVSIAEVGALVDVDREGGLDRLVTLLVQNDGRAEAAAAALAELGPEAATRVAARFDELESKGKKRALRVLGKHLSLPAARERLAASVRANDDTSGPALLVIKSSGDEGREMLRQIAQDATPFGDEAVQTLARARGESMALLHALSATGGSERPVLRRALATSAGRDAKEFEAAVQTWLGEDPSLSARVVLALVLSQTGEHSARALSIAVPALSSAKEFPDRYRLALALAQAAESPEADGWLSRVATDSPEWMLRKVALGALLKRSPKEGQAIAQNLVRDPYPRVRASAVSALNAAVSKAQVEQLARKDGWPIVREAAVRALADAPASRETLRAAVDDESRRVRAAAIDGLTKTQDRDAWSMVMERLRAPGEWPEVHAAAMRFAASLCIHEAREPVSYFLRSALRPDVTEEEAQLGAVAYEALLSLGGPAEADAKLLVSRDTVPAAVRRAAKSPPARSCSGPSGAGSRTAKGQ